MDTPFAGQPPNRDIFRADRQMDVFDAIVLVTAVCSVQSGWKDIGGLCR